MANNYDVVILGGGMGGYVAAIRAAQLGLKTAIVEKDKLGGTCLHRGCIPSKALLRSAEVYQTAKNSHHFGVVTSGVTLDFSKVQMRKNAIVSQLYSGVQHLMNKGKIETYEGKGRLLGPSIFSPLSGAVSVEMNDGQENEILVPQNLIIATGSRPRPLPGFEFDGEYILSSDDALELKSLPKSMIIVGGGAIGVEWASMLADFDVDVTVIEYAKQLLPQEDEEIGEEINRQLKRKGVHIVTNTKVISHNIEKNDKTVAIQVDENDERKEYVAQKLLVCVGREAVIDGIGIENTEIEIEQSYIKTNEYFQTAESHIYAVGDCIGGLQLAHVASREGIIAVEHLAGLKPDKLPYEHVPKCVYSNPEIASVGLTSNEAKEKGYEVKVGKFPLSANGKALLYGEEAGFVKLIVDALTDDLLGIQMIGPHVTEMISEVGLAKVLDATPWEISQTIHPHPSISEAIAEAALAVDGLQLHI